MGINLDEGQKGKHRIAVMAVLLTGSCFLTYYCHVILETGTIFTHLFYIPIIAASIWWKRRGLVVAAFLAVMLISSHISFRNDLQIAGDLLRSSMFIIVAIATAVLSERITRERAHRESERRHAEIINFLPDATFGIDLEGKVVAWNRAIEEMTGVKSEDMLGKGNYEYALPFYGARRPMLIDLVFKPVEEIEKGYSYIRREGNTLLAEAEVPFVKGKSLFLWGTAGPIFDYKGEVIGAIESTRDITKIRQTEEALRESEERYRTLIESTLDLVFTVDSRGIYTYVNPIFEKATGYAASDLIGRPFTCIVAPELIESTVDRFKQGIRGKAVSPYEADIVHKNGRRIPVEFLVTTLYDTDGKPTGRFGIGRDITDRKRAEEEKKKLEAQLQQAQKMESIGTLAGGIAHDFNNILAAIIGYTELVDLDVPEGSKTKYNLKEVLKAGRRAKDLVGQVLAFGRRSEQERKPVQISPIVKEALKLLRASIPTTIEIRQNIGADLGTILADPTQVHQVLMNLCTNAGHAMREKGGILEVGLANVEIDSDFAAEHPNIDPGFYLRLTVSDTGHGMTPEVMERVFDPYFSTKEKDMGTGLGLAVVHGLVIGHGGAITVQSEPGKGSTFHVYLPIIDREEMPEADTTEESLPRGDERILFVDDEQVLVDVGKEMLEHLGYEVVTRTSSIEALELFREQPDGFNLVITDMTMPNMRGDNLAEELLDIRPDIPIILCTGFSEHISEEKAKEIGIREFVMKPLVMRDLANIIRKELTFTH
ncbi:MAG: PAS domain S-box protein [Proteobacteria bacterium]|nr:PAS domain S-box protein [Pseudomonadota bacterium]